MATIVCHRHSSIGSIFNAIAKRKSHKLFSNNPTSLTIEDITKIHHFRADSVLTDRSQSRRAEWPGVVRLHLLFNQGDDEVYEMGQGSVRALFGIFPNLKDIDMSFLRAPVHLIVSHCPLLSRLTWKSSKNCLYLNGAYLSNADNLKELYVDDSCFASGFSENTGVNTVRRLLERNNTNPEWFLFLRYNHLERLSIKGARWGRFRWSRDEFPVSQNMLIKMVRLHPTLRWLRSDLTPENLTMLQAERPEITFVTE